MHWFFFFFSPRANHQQKRQRSYRNSLLWQSLLLMPSTKQVNRTRPNQKLVSCQNAVGIKSVTVLHCFDVHRLYTVSCACQWSLQRALTGVGISVAITRLELQSAVSNTWVKTDVELVATPYLSLCWFNNLLLPIPVHLRLQWGHAGET